MLVLLSDFATRCLFRSIQWHRCWQLKSECSNGLKRSFVKTKSLRKVIFNVCILYSVTWYIVQCAVWMKTVFVDVVSDAFAVIFWMLKRFKNVLSLKQKVWQKLSELVFFTVFLVHCAMHSLNENGVCWCCFKIMFWCVSSSDRRYGDWTVILIRRLGGEMDDRKQSETAAEERLCHCWGKRVQQLKKRKKSCFLDFEKT